MSWATLPSVAAVRAKDVRFITGANFWRVIALA